MIIFLLFYTLVTSKIFLRIVLFTLPIPLITYIILTPTNVFTIK